MAGGMIITRKYFPPGFNYEREWKWALILFGGGVAFSLRYYFDLYREIGSLYCYKYERLGEEVRRFRVLQEGVVAGTFMHLVGGHFMFYVPFFLYLAVMMVIHYIYYCNTEKCLYLMRRLPKKGALLKSLVQAPLFGILSGILCLSLLYLLYYIVYLIMIPKGCLP